MKMMHELRELIRQDAREMFEDFAVMIGRSFEHVEKRLNGIEETLDRIDSRLGKAEIILETSVSQQGGMRSQIKDHEKRLIDLENPQTF